MHGVGASSSSDGKLMVFRGGGRMNLGRKGEGCDGGSDAAGYPASDEDKYRGGVPVTSQEGDTASGLS